MTFGIGPEMEKAAYLFIGLVGLLFIGSLLFERIKKGGGTMRFFGKLSGLYGQRRWVKKK